MAETILALDDNPVNLDVIQSTLEPFGYKVIPTTDLAQALELARRVHPDMILSDLYMPGTSGYDFISAVKLDPALKDIPFVVITSHRWGTLERQSSLALGADKFIYRPIEPQALLDEIRLVLEQRHKDSGAAKG